MQKPTDSYQTLIELKAVTKVYGSGDAAVHALAGANLKIGQGEFAAIMGPSGSGKSTAMNIIGCLDTPSSGSYFFKGIDVGSLSRDQRALLRRHFLGFVFQGFNLLPRTSAIENVELPLVYRGMAVRGAAGSGQAGARSCRASRAGKATRPISCPAASSSVSPLRARSSPSPAVLLADEPTGNLDTKTSHDIMDLITSLNRDQGITVIMVTHEADIAAYAQRVIGFLDGRIASDALNKEAA